MNLNALRTCLEQQFPADIAPKRRRRRGLRAGEAARRPPSRGDRRRAAAEGRKEGEAARGRPQNPQSPAMASPQKGRRRGRRRPSLDMLLTTHQAEISLLSMSPTAAGPEPEDYAEDKNAGSTALSARPSGKRAPFGNTRPSRARRFPADGSRRRRGCHVDGPRWCAATPRRQTRAVRITEAALAAATPRRRRRGRPVSTALAHGVCRRRDTHRRRPVETLGTT